MSRSRTERRQQGQLRIIGGDWRGRKLSFPALEGLRPTPDRVRETLFNWLQMDIAGARCLDLFAGSGALGLEALSRGAAEVIFVEKSARAAGAIRDHLALLKSGRGQVVNSDALNFLTPAATPFDIIFLDPPYALELLPGCCQQLAAGDWLAPEAHIYIEAPSHAPLPPLPTGWQLIRSKKAGDVGYHLARREV